MRYANPQVREVDGGLGEHRERYRTPRNSNSTPVSHPSPSAVARNSGCIGDYSALSSLRQTFVEWAGEAIPHSFWAAAYYRQQRDRGCSHQAALRALTFKWIRISIAAGRTARPTTNRHTSMRSNAAARHYSARSRRRHRTLDSPPQGVIGSTPPCFQ